MPDDQNPKITDDLLIAIIRDHDDCDGQASTDPATTRALAEECLRARRLLRKDSRRAEQIKRVRWQLELVTKKLEEIEAQDKLERERDRAEQP